MSVRVPTSAARLGESASPALDRALFAYAIAGGAGVIAAGSADAAIIYSGLLNQSVGFGSTVDLDFDGGGVDLTFHNATFNPGFTDARAMSAASVGIASPSSTDAFNFTAGAAIDSSSKYTTSSNKILASFDGSGGQVSGNFPANATGFLGFQLNGTDYGWVRLTLGAPLDGTNSYTIVDWAYDDSGAPILAGQTTAAAIPLPAAAALAGLAIGASALRSRRQRARAGVAR